MSVRGRILALQIVGVVSLCLALATAGFALWQADHSARRIDGINERVDVLSQLIGSTGRYASKVAEVLFLGRQGAGDLDAVQIDVERQLARLTQATRAEFGTLFGPAELQAQLPELEGSRRIIEVFHAIDASVNRMMAQQRAGQQAAAIEMYRVEIAFRLTNELWPLLETAADNERAEVVAEVQSLGTTETTLVGVGGAVAVLSVLLLLITGFSLRRAVVEPLAGLTGRARILAAGGRDEPYAVPAGNEYASLALSLDTLAEAIAEQRQHFATAGEKLSAEVDARTSELQTVNARLREIDRRRGQFLADVSHELRTPLTILRGEADVGLRGKGDPAVLRGALEAVQGQAAELGKLLEDLINYARTEAEDQPYVVAETRLDDVIAAASQEAEVLAAAREVSIVVRLNDKGRHLSADFRRLRQGLLIGLDNAIKHSPPGGEVEISTATEGDHVAIRIADQGPGVAEADLPHVFERFFRGRSNGEPLADGVGIGLAIAKEIIERHSGSIDLGNRAEGGAVLTILLPLETVPA